VYVLQIGTEKGINLVYTLFKISQKVLKAFDMCIFLKFLNHTHTIRHSESITESSWISVSSYRGWRINGDSSSTS